MNTSVQHLPLSQAARYISWQYFAQTCLERRTGIKSVFALVNLHIWNDHLPARNVCVE